MEETGREKGDSKKKVLHQLITPARRSVLLKSETSITHTSGANSKGAGSWETTYLDSLIHYLRGCHCSYYLALWNHVGEQVFLQPVLRYSSGAFRKLENYQVAV